MANFQYSALDAKGEQTNGTVSANNETEAIQQLRAKGLYPTHIQEEGKGKQGKDKQDARGASSGPPVDGAGS